MEGFAHVQSKNARSDLLARLLLEKFQIRILQIDPLCFIYNMHTHIEIKMNRGLVVFSSSSGCNVTTAEAL